MKLTWNNH